MARAARKPTSRRRAAALKFLSNISFEMNTIGKEKFRDQILTLEEEKRFFMRKLESDDDIEVNEFVSSRFLEMECVKSSTFISYRERSNTENSECRREHNVSSHRKLDENPYPATFSSSESITSGSGKPNKLDFDPRLHKFREIKLAKANDLRNHKNDRIMLVSSVTKTPFYIFSFVPYKKTKTRGDGKKEWNSRRRNLSGSRPLSSFIDTLDPFLLLGLEKCQDEQMISYQQLLLLPSTATTETKESSCQEINNSNLDTGVLKNYQIARCMSVDLGVSSKVPLVPSLSPLFSEFRANEWEECGHSPELYSPFLLDDPELMSGKHRTVLTFPSYRASLIDYVRPSDLKKELNEKFREKFPHIQLTLSKLRSLKREMKRLSKAEKCIDLLTVAQAYVYFEKLILRNVISKTNRKLCAAVCLLLSAKMNDTKGTALKQLLEKLESVFRLNRKDVLALEFAVVVALEFSLHVPTWEILPHYQRLVHES